jgi:hypothetical protein
VVKRVGFILLVIIFVSTLLAVAVAGQFYFSRSVNNSLLVNKPVGTTAVSSPTRYYSGKYIWWRDFSRLERYLSRNKYLVEGKRLTRKEAVRLVQNYLKKKGFTWLVPLEIWEFDVTPFYVVVGDRKSKQGAFELLIQPITGYISLEMGPGMMWNTKYGPGLWGCGQMTTGVFEKRLNKEEARKIAQTYLRKMLPGTVVKDGRIFPGYYTFHVARKGKESGVISVNSFSGAVWYHAWHGSVIAVEVLESHSPETSKGGV